MENIILDKINTISKNTSKDNSIIEKLQELNLYLKTDNNCQHLLKLSKQELQNEIKYKSRAEKIQKYHRKHDQIILEENIIHELQQYIEEKLEPKTIAEIYDKIMILKMSDIKDVNLLKAFIKSNNMALKEITKIEKEIYDTINKLSPKNIPSMKTEIQAIQTLNNSRDHRSPTSLSNDRILQRNYHNTNYKGYYRARFKRVINFENTNDNIIVTEPQSNSNEEIRMRLETDHTKLTNNSINQSIIEQNTRFRNTDDWGSYNIMLQNMDDEFCSLNSTVNLHKDNEDNNSEDVLLILQPLNSWKDI